MEIGKRFISSGIALRLQEEGSNPPSIRILGLVKSCILLRRMEVGGIQGQFRLASVHERLQSRSAARDFR